MTQKRRRGTELEEAIYQATREILDKEGLPALTFPKVAEMAETSKPVIYRRWHSPFALAIAAIQDKIKLENNGRTDEIKFTGNSLRDDLLQVMQRFIVSMNTFGKSYMSVFFSGMSEQENEAMQKMIMESARIDVSAIDRVLERAQKRNELSVINVTNDLKLLPFEWLRYHLFLNKKVDNKKLTMLVDDVLIPSYQHVFQNRLK
ncbi:TetR/AcrR family transcriptional regulator [Pediococcus ethanolidurans]|nr:TetR family transcriptional regulator [Pediococcus ethanolidurans]GEN95718.1 TetR family transcriptional regulator [Pediococcus ethanolidurans]SER82804.1 transcriptional regulator, TetR family [Pediococcus ethanolidurans]